MRHKRESNVVTDLCLLLVEIGIDPSEIEREHPSGGGRIDIYIPRYRMIIEAKASGGATQPDVVRAGQGESPRQQLERYLEAEVSAELERLSLAGDEHCRRAWTGILTDGRTWHANEYRHAWNPAAQPTPLHSGRFSGTAEGLAGMLAQWLAGDPVGRQWIPADPSTLFAEKAKELARLYREIPANIRRKTDTKRALWHDLLRVSGMSPRGGTAPDRLFVLHSLLIAIARMVTCAAAGRTGGWERSLRDGFASWTLDWPQGRAWTAGLWNTVSDYDWRRRGDVLRSLYEAFVPEADRKVFGEFYTPDWLAAMLVEQALDDKWLADSVERAEDAIRRRSTFRGRGVLDPACGSGTFLYHAALRILAAPAMKGLTAVQRADVAALLLNGIDVHPVAIEIAKANLMRVLPAEPSEGEAALRVYLGDSLLADEDRQSLFGHVEGAMRLVTPQESEILIPVEFVQQEGFADGMRRLVDAAARGEPLPPAVLHLVPEGRREDLRRCRDELASVIGEEGNSVWTWYAVNLASPHLLAQRKVDRIVANPPWVKLAHIQEPERKRAMERLGERLRLQAGGKQAPHLDIAAFFVVRARELYLNDPEVDPAVWLVKKSALRGGHWRPFRKRHGETLSQSVDLERLQPFGGGDARRCCLLLEHRPLTGELAQHTRQDPHQDASAEAQRVEADLRSRPSGPKRLRKPQPEEPWSAVAARLQFTVAPAPLPQAPSGYSPGEFRQGATVVPNVLLVAERTSPAFGMARVRTLRSQHRPWRDVGPQDVEVPKGWLSKLYRSVEMLSFVSSFRGTQAIIPVNDQGELSLDSALAEPGWQRLNTIYVRHRGKGQNTPKTLAGRINYGRGLSSQPQRRASDRCMVLYPTSADIMRAARTAAGGGFVGHTLFWKVAGSESEAGFLVSLLNAPCLRRAFADARESGRHFVQHPWRKVPIPRYDANDRRHVRLVKLCAQAETAASEASREVQQRTPNASQRTLSIAVRDRLSDDGISRSIDLIAAELLPNQAELSDRDALRPNGAPAQL